MGSKPAPSYANIHLAETIDPRFKEIAKGLAENGDIPIKLLKRCLDDIFMVFTGSVKNLHVLFEELNKIHPKIKFTMTLTTPEFQSTHDQCSCEPIISIAFLDTLCTIKEGKIETDLYRKPTYQNQYLLTNSCHPTEVISNIPYSLGLRIIRTCGETESKDLRLKEPKEMLVARKYPIHLIDSAISTARLVSREQSLRLVSRTKLNT